MGGGVVGDIVITPFPYTDLSSLKVRPALVLADVGMGDWILCEVTTSVAVRPNYVSIARRDVVNGRLRFDSHARTDRLVTLNDRIFRSTVGPLTSTKLAEITAAARALF